MSAADGALLHCYTHMFTHVERDRRRIYTPIFTIVRCPDGFSHMAMGIGNAAKSNINHTLYICSKGNNFLNYTTTKNICMRFTCDVCGRTECACRDYILFLFVIQRSYQGKTRRHISRVYALFILQDMALTYPPGSLL